MLLELSVRLATSYGKENKFCRQNRYHSARVVCSVVFVLNLLPKWNELQTGLMFPAENYDSNHSAGRFRVRVLILVSKSYAKS